MRIAAISYDRIKHQAFPLLVTLLGISVVSFFTVLSHLNYRFTSHHKQMVYSIQNIKYQLDNSHLSLEEYLHRESKDDKKAHSNILSSLATVHTLLHGGTINGFHYDPEYNDAEITGYLDDIRRQLELLKPLTLSLTLSAPGFSQDIYHGLYASALRSANSLDAYISKKFLTMHERYVMIEYALLVSVLLFFVFVILYLRSLRHEMLQSQRLSHIDTLTQAANFRAYYTSLNKLLELQKEQRQTFSIIMFDIDDFKHINDTYGHNTGDKVLIDLVALVQQNIRADDHLFRVGGEEFIILSKNSDIRSATAMAQRVRNTIQRELRTIRDHKITISIGVCESMPEDTTEKLYKRVDDLLYVSKKNGKNMVTSELDTGA